MSTLKSLCTLWIKFKFPARFKIIFIFSPLAGTQFSVNFVLKIRQDPQTELALLETGAHVSWTLFCRERTGRTVLYSRNSRAVPPVPASLTRQQLAGSGVPCAGESGRVWGPAGVGKGSSADVLPQPFTKRGL